jgi:hypothetical protein
MRIMTTALVFVLLIIPTGVTSAAGDEDSDHDVTTNEETGDVGVTVISGVVYTPGGGSGPKCTWNRYSQGDWETATATPPPEPRQYDIPDEGLTPEERAARNAERELDARRETERRSRTKVTNFNGEPHHVYDVRCTGFSGSLRLVPANLDADDLLPGLIAAAHSRIELPVPNVSPQFDFGGYVNLGMWLAVEPATFEPLTAEAGPVWATLTAAHDSITFDFGNGDTRNCQGFGTPIVDENTIDEGPCGYTYRHSSPDDAPYSVGVTTTWNISYTSSGESGVLDPFNRTATFAHDVDEIQTIGREN